LGIHHFCKRKKASSIRYIPKRNDNGMFKLPKRIFKREIVPSVVTSK